MHQERDQCAALPENCPVEAASEALEADSSGQGVICMTNFALNDKADTFQDENNAKHWL
jgi:hypothetical protein